MKFENKLNKEHLREVLVNWVLGTDGQNGTTCEIENVIPWDYEMEQVIRWEDVFGDIDEAIGKRRNFDVYKLLIGDSTFINRQNFYAYIEETVNNIYRVYSEIIDKLNKKYEEGHFKAMIKVDWVLDNDVVYDTHTYKGKTALQCLKSFYNDICYRSSYVDGIFHKTVKFEDIVDQMLHIKSYGEKIRYGFKGEYYIDCRFTWGSGIDFCE